MLPKRYRPALLIVAVIFISGLVFAATGPARNPLDWLSSLEMEVKGETSATGLIERLDQLEVLITGRVREGSIVQRLTYLDNLLHLNQPHDIALVSKIQALEWVLYKECFSGPFKERLEKIENLLFNQKYAGPITQRLEKLVSQVFPDNAVKGRWLTVPAGLPVRIRTVEAISSLRNKAGDCFRFEVAETVIAKDLVVLPKGVTGEVVLQSVRPPGNLGTDARLFLEFGAVKALDGTKLDLMYGSKALALNKKRKIAVGVSAAGMLFLGPEGILAGIAVKGEETVIPANTEFYLQVREPVRIYTLSV